MSDEASVATVFRELVKDVARAAQAEGHGVQVPTAIDVELQLHDVRYDRARGRLFSRRLSETTRTMSIRLATRIVVQSADDVGDLS